MNPHDYPLGRLKSAPAALGKALRSDLRGCRDRRYTATSANHDSIKTNSPRVDDWGRGALFYCESAKAVNEVFRSPHTDCAAPDMRRMAPDPSSLRSPQRRSYKGSRRAEDSDAPSSSIISRPQSC